MSRRERLERVQAQLQSQLKLHAETSLQQVLIHEREKVLCDLAVHQKLMAGLCASHQQAAAGAEAPVQRAEQAPYSHIAQLLRDVTQTEVAEVVQMSVAEWLGYFANTVPKLVFLLELINRGELTSSPAATAAAQNVAAGAEAADTAEAEAATAEPDCQRVGSSSDSNAGHTSSSNILQQWFGPEAPTATSIAQNYEQLQKASDPVLRRVMLGYVFNHLPLLEACAFSYSPGPQVTPSAQHWELVIDKLQLTELQQLHMSICLSEYLRLSKGDRANGDQLLQQASTPTLIVAAAEQQQRQVPEQRVAAAAAQLQAPQQPFAAQAQQPHAVAATTTACNVGRSSSASTATRLGTAACGSNLQQQQQQQSEATEQQESPLTELCEGGQDKLQQQLKQYVRRRHVHLLGAATFMLNVLSPYQRAVLLCSSYPWIPSLTAIARIVNTRQQQRLQQQIEQGRLPPALEASLANPQRPVTAAGVPLPAGATRATMPGTAPAAATDRGNIGKSGGGGRHGTGAGRAEDHATGGFVQQEIEQHQRTRVQELELHRQLVWSEVGTEVQHWQ